MEVYRSRHEVRVLNRSGGNAELGEALAVYVRNTSPSLRTQTSQIQAKFANPDNPHGKLFYASLREGRSVVGFVMFCYYPRTRLVVIDHLAIDAGHRDRGAFYVFASLLQNCIEQQCPEFDYVAAEIAIDPEFAGDGVNGITLVRLLRRVGFGQVHVRYDLPGMDAKALRKPHLGTLMVRGAQKVSEIRSEAFLDLHTSILFEHYLPWFDKFLGSETAVYRKQLQRLQDDLRGRLKGKAAVVVNGGDHDELGTRRKQTSSKVMGVHRATIGHVAVFSALLLLIGLFQTVVRLDGRGLAATVAVAAFVYLALAAQSGVTGYRVFDRFGGVIAKILFHRS